MVRSEIGITILRANGSKEDLVAVPNKPVKPVGALFEIAKCHSIGEILDLLTRLSQAVDQWTLRQARFIGPVTAALVALGYLVGTRSL